MRLIFPTATVASISGAFALAATMSSSQVLAASASFAYDEEMRSGLVRPRSSKTQGSECALFGSSNKEGLRADTGILKCDGGLTCAADSSSSTGGKCTTTTVKDVQVAVKSERRLDSGIPCTFLNGTAGVKCSGVDACTKTDEAKIGCGSCIGEESCYWMGDTTIVGEGSCIGEEACYSFNYREQATIGDNSCIGKLSCNDSEEMKVGPNSCQGYKSCYDMNGDVTIGNNSCVGEYACCYINSWATNPTPVVVGDYSCRNETNACFFVDGNVGNFSCWGFEACERMEDNIAIGSHSCHGYQSCNSMGDSGDTSKNEVGDYSCIGKQACFESYNSDEERNTGYKSCVGELACYGMAGSIGSYSCNAEKACYKGTASSDVGDCLCNADLACAYLDGSEKDYDNCPAPTLKPTASPTTAKPTSDPTKKPTMSPSKNPTTSPVITTTTTPMTTIRMDSTLQWNVECSSLDSAALVTLAQIIEKSVYDGIESQLSNGNGVLQSTYVSELCDQLVDEHSPYPDGLRRLQTGSSTDVKLYSVVSSDCIGCQQEMFTATNNALTTIVENGSLADSIQSESGGTIDVVIDPVVDSSFVIVNAPTGAPTSKSKAGKMAKNQKSAKAKIRKTL